ncbi:MAG: TonB-dependent receptor [Gammaproteobacteria bacterium]|nr:TonB-dependent receptor [Gammaproteobacteria bacterium]
MPNDVFKKTPLAAAISLAMASASASAQETPPQSGAAPTSGSIEEVVVVGIRQSLKQSMDLKRNRDGVVDAITAEDIGDFPDSNLAESLQRITGVSIDRERGEGARVTVRGFGPDFNLVLLNGRQMPTSSGLGRSFDFGNLASEGISAVEVYKTGQADVPTGGIGATMNIRTTRPLEASGMNFTAAASGLHDASTEEGSGFTPEISALFSNTFADDTVGIALSAVRQDRNNGANTANVGGWRTFPGEVDNCWCGIGPSEWGGIPPHTDPNQQNRPGEGDLYSVPQAIGYELAEYARLRTNGQLTLQWQASESLVATLDYTYSEVELERTYNNLSAWFNFGGQETLWTDGPQATPLTYTENLPGSDYSMAAGNDAWRARNGATGINLLWDVTDRLSVEFDYHDSDAERKPNSPYGDSSLLSTASFTRSRTTGHFGADLPVLQLTLANPLDPNDMIVTGSVFTNNFSKMNIEQTRLGGVFDFDTGFIESVDFGIQLTEVNNRSAGSVVQRDAWGGVTQRGAIADLLEPASASDAFDQVPGGDDARRQVDFFTFDMTEVIARTEALMASGEATTFMLTDMGDCGTGLCASSRFTSDRRTTEESQAFYVQVNMSMEWGASTVDLRAGLRYEETDISSQALSPAYTRIDWVAGNELTAVQGSPDFTSLEGNYDLLLPSFDFRIDLTDSLVGRVSYSETMTRPNYGDIQGGQTINSLLRIDGGTGNRGNPNLLPFESKNTDVSVEYYYSEDSYVAVGYFYKDVDNFIGTSSVVEETFGLPHPALGPLGDEARAATGSSDGGALYSWIIENRPDASGVDAASGVITGVAGRDPASPFNLTVPVNIEQATMKGWEVVAQHNFGETGFGVIANATVVDADVGYDNFSLEQQFVLTGLSDSANLIVFYDKEGISVRVAYNWRDDFLAGTGQNNVGAGPPTYVGAYQQVDLSASYWFNDNMQVYVDMLNLTDETTHVYGRDRLQTLFAGQAGPRYNIGFRYKL